MTSTSFYKYRGINNDDLSKDFSLDALLKSHAIFSSRKNFNDLFDSKVHFELPTYEQLASLMQNPMINMGKKNMMSNFLHNGKITSIGNAFLKNLESGLNEIIDAYPIYSVSRHNTSNLLWAYYSSSHKGFCIEFNFDEMEQPEKVTYQEDIAAVSLLDFLKYDVGINNNTAFGIKIKKALLVKLKEWHYEGEYRWILSDKIGIVPKGEKYIIIDYAPRKVKSIIFGCRMLHDIKKYIIKNLPFTTVFKQAIETRNSIEVIDFDPKKHL